MLEGSYSRSMTLVKNR